MLNKVLEICEENRYLSLNRGFLVVKHENEVLGQVPLDDIGVLLISSQSASFSKNILNALAERNCITVLCGNNYNPQSLIIPIVSNCLQSKIIKNQITASEPLKKRIWQQLVIKKIKNQALTLDYCHINSTKLNLIATTVKSGDADNREAYAAKLYWQSLFGKDFKRDREAPGINSLLNYGYAIIRSAMARSIVCAGLMPALGLHHENNLNPFCLVDDMMEIYRPIVDLFVYNITKGGESTLNPETKKMLANLLLVKVQFNEENTQLVQSMHYLANSYVKALEFKKPVIELPVWEGNKDGITIIE